jgi:hypothetical protein
MTYIEHARHILSVLGFKGEELELQARILAKYLAVNFPVSNARI